MAWYFFPLIAAFLWAVTNHIDKYLVSGYSARIKYTSFVVVTGVFSSLLAIAIFFFKPDVLGIDLKFALLMMTGGAFFIIYLFPYYYALDLEEASVVVPMFQMIPILVLALAFIFLKETLSVSQILAGMVIISGSFGLTMDLTEKVRFKKQLFLLMFSSSLLVALGILTFKFVAINTSFWTAIFWQEIGKMVPVIAVLFVKKYRENFMNIAIKNLKFISTMSVNEIINVTANLSMNYSYILVPVALSNFISSVQPLFVLMIGIVLTLTFPKLVFENLSRKFLTQKIIFVLLILVGSYYLFTS